jgi:hypothetical protein
LEALGFDISRASHSNYMETWLSVASMADLRHLRAESLGGAFQPEPTVHRRLSRLFNEARSWPILRAHGYEIVTTDAAFADINLYTADRFVGGSPLNAFETDLLRLSPVTRLGIVSQWIIDSFRHRVIDELDAVSRVTSDRSLFVWAHILSPHAPAIFDRNGESLPHPCYPLRCPFFQPHAEAMGLGEAALEERLVGQVDYLNRLVVRAVRSITARDPSAVIVILSDHGSRTGEPSDEYFRSFFAARTPGHKGLFPTNVGMVTTMAVLLNTYVDAGVDVPDGDPRFMRATTPLDLIEWTQR